MNQRKDRLRKERVRNVFTKTDSDRLTHMAAELKRLMAEFSKPDKDHPRILDKA